MPHSAHTLSDAELVRQSDTLLQSSDDAPDRPLTDRQMLRRMRREVPAGLELPERPASPDVYADLRTVAAMTPLTSRQRQVFEMWVEGWTLQEIGCTIGVATATACRTLRAALLRCWLMGPVPFGEFSRRSIYRPPSHGHRGYRSGRRCEVCAAPLWDDGHGTCCGSDYCQGVLRMRRRLDRRRAGWGRRTL